MYFEKQLFPRSFALNGCAPSIELLSGAQTLGSCVWRDSLMASRTITYTSCTPLPLKLSADTIVDFHFLQEQLSNVLKRPPKDSFPYFQAFGLLSTGMQLSICIMTQQFLNRCVTTLSSHKTYCSCFECCLIIRLLARTHLIPTKKRKLSRKLKVNKSSLTSSQTTPRKTNLQVNIYFLSFD